MCVLQPGKRFIQNKQKTQTVLYVQGVSYKYRQDQASDTILMTRNVELQTIYAQIPLIWFRAAIY